MKSVIDRIKYDYNIYITVHTLSELNQVKKIYNNYKNIKCFKMDITLEKDIDILDNLNLDILICNAAVMESGSLLDIPFNNIRYNFEVNYFSNLKIIKKVIIKNSDVKVIVMSSLAGNISLPFAGAYSSSKAALSKMMDSLFYEVKLLNKNVDVVVVEPGFYKTGFNKYGFDKKYDFMDIDSFFKYQIDVIKKSENIILKIFEKKRLDSISKKIVKAVRSSRPRHYYRAPFYQVLFVKLYNFFS